MWVLRSVTYPEPPPRGEARSDSEAALFLLRVITQESRPRIVLIPGYLSTAVMYTQWLSIDMAVQLAVHAAVAPL